MKRSYRAIDIYDLLWRERFVTIPQLSQQTGMYHPHVRRLLKSLMRQYPFIQMEHRTASGRHGQKCTAYFIDRDYKQQVLGEI